MKMNNNPAYCASIIDCGAYERKKESEACFMWLKNGNKINKLKSWVNRFQFVRKNELSSSQNMENRMEYFPGRIF